MEYLIVLLIVAGAAYWFYNQDKCNRSPNNEGDKVLNYLNQHGSINVDEAKTIGIKHLRSVICKLKKGGKQIKNVNPLGQKAEYKFK